MAGKRYVLKEEISTGNLEGIEATLIDLLGVRAIMKTHGGFTVKTTMDGESARELNRSGLHSLQDGGKLEMCAFRQK